MDNWFKSKWFVRGISLAFAIVLYIFVNITVNETQQDPTFSERSGDIQRIDEVPVEIRIDDENYVVSGVPDTVAVTLEGQTSVLTPTIIQQNFTVYVDLQNLGTGEHTVEIEYDNMPSGLNVYIEPEVINVTIEERATETFPVTAELINRDQMAPGYEISEYSIETEEVEITSSKSNIDQIGVVKIFIDVSDLDESIRNEEVPVNVYDLQGNELNVGVDPGSIEVSVEVNNPSKTVPVTVATTGELPDGYAVSSMSANVEEVEIFGTSNVLEGVTEVSTEEIDLSEITGSETIDTNLDLPDNVVAPDVESIEVEVEIEQSRTFNDIPMEVQGLGDGQSVTFIDPENPRMDITIVGDDGDLDELTEEDIRAFIDVEGLSAGEHEVPVTAETSEGEEISTAENSDQVTIEIE